MAANGAIQSAAMTAINGGSVGETLEAGLMGGLRAGLSETAKEVKNMLPTLKVGKRVPTDPIDAVMYLLCACPHAVFFKI